MKGKLIAALAFLLTALLICGCTVNVDTNNDGSVAITEPDSSAEANAGVTPNETAHDAESNKNKTPLKPPVVPEIDTNRGLSVTTWTDMVFDYRDERKALLVMETPENNFWNSIDGKDDYIIPVYNYDEILFLDYEENTNDDIVHGWTNYRIGFMTDYNTHVVGIKLRPYQLCGLAMLLRRGALRENPQNTDNAYVMYDTNEGHRIYFFLDKSHERVGNWMLVGTPVIMSQKVSFADYKPLLKKGADVDSLVPADPAMQAVSDQLYGPMSAYLKWDGRGEYDVAGMMELWKIRNYSMVSAFILTDGVLYINWGYLDGKFVVDAYEYHDDFIHESHGISVCYRINEEDYVG